MRKAALALFAFMIVIALSLACGPLAHADYFRYPCAPPGVGTGVDVNIIVDAQGQFCDGPTEINLTHYHCESGGANVNLGAIAIAPIGPGGVGLGGFGGQGLGAGGGGCSWRCPDNTLGPAPNPPGMWQRSFIDVRSVIKRNRAFCVTGGHLLPAGPTSALTSPDEGFPDSPDKPWEQGDPSIVAPGPPLPPADPAPGPVLPGPPLPGLAPSP